MIAPTHSAHKNKCRCFHWRKLEEIKNAPDRDRNQRGKLDHEKRRNSERRATNMWGIQKAQSILPLGSSCEEEPKHCPALMIPSRPLPDHGHHYLQTTSSAVTGEQGTEMTRTEIHWRRGAVGGPAPFRWHLSL